LQANATDNHRLNNIKSREEKEREEVEGGASLSWPHFVATLTACRVVWQQQPCCCASHPLIIDANSEMLSPPPLSCLLGSPKTSPLPLTHVKVALLKLTGGCLT